jgi:hypothetical protein
VCEREKVGLKLRERERESVCESEWSERERAEGDDISLLFPHTVLIYLRSIAKNVPFKKCGLFFTSKNRLFTMRQGPIFVKFKLKSISYEKICICYT